MLRKKKCKNKSCSVGYFRPPEESPDIGHCSPECATAILEKAWAKQREQRKKALRRSEKAQKAKHSKQKREFYENDIKTRRDAAVREFNKFIRLRDSNEPCISCGTTKPVKYDAGHYITAGSCTALRFDEKNVHKQCSWYCNKNLSGNINGYTEGLVSKFGQERIDYLKGPQPVINITVDFYREIEDKYKIKCKIKCKELENA